MILPPRYRRKPLLPLDGEFEFAVDADQDYSYEQCSGPKEIRVTKHGVFARLADDPEWQFASWVDLLDFERSYKNLAKELRKQYDEGLIEGIRQGRLQRAAMAGDPSLSAQSSTQSPPASD